MRPYDEMVQLGKIAAGTTGGRMANSYEELVEQGRKVATELGKSNFKLGKLAAEVETKHAEHTLESYADDIGVSSKHLWACRNVERRLELLFENSSREEFSLPSWKVTQTILLRTGLETDERRVLLKHAADEKWTVSRTYKELGIATNSRWQRTEKIEKVQQALQDPEVVEQVLNDPTTRQAVNKAQIKWYTEAVEPVRKSYPMPTDSPNADFLEGMKYLDQMHAAAVRGLKLHNSIQDFSEEEQRIALQRIGMVELALMWWKSHIEQGKDLDEELRQLTKGS